MAVVLKMMILKTFLLNKKQRLFTKLPFDRLTNDSVEILKVNSIE